jgi:hypothetical protein
MHDARGFSDIRPVVTLDEEFAFSFGGHVIRDAPD